MLLPAGEKTKYWVASRCTNLYSDRCGFDVRCVNSGLESAYPGYEMFVSDIPDVSRDICNSLFPIVSLNSQLIKGNAISGYSVK